MAIAFDSFGTLSSTAGGSVFTWTQTINTQNNSIIIAFPGASNNPLSNIAYAGTSMTKLIVGTQVADPIFNEMWYLLNPPAGLGTFHGTWGGTQGEVDIVSVAYTGVNQTTPFSGSVRSIGTAQQAGSITNVITGSNWFVGGYMCDNSVGTAAIGNARGTSASGGLNIVSDSTGGTLQWTNVAGGVGFAIVGGQMQASSVTPSTVALGYKSLLGVGL